MCCSNCLEEQYLIGVLKYRAYEAMELDQWTFAFTCILQHLPSYFFHYHFPLSLQRLVSIHLFYSERAELSSIQSSVYVSFGKLASVTLEWHKDCSLIKLQELTVFVDTDLSVFLLRFVPFQYNAWSENHQICLCFHLYSYAIIWGFSFFS